MKKAIFAILFIGLGISQSSLALGPSNETNAGVTCDYAREKILEMQNESQSTPFNGQVSTGAEVSQHRSSDDAGN